MEVGRDALFGFYKTITTPRKHFQEHLKNFTFPIKIVKASLGSSVVLASLNFSLK